MAAQKEITMDGLNLTPQMLADRWFSNVNTLRDWRYRNGPRLIKVGRKVLYSTVEVDAYEKRNL